MIILKLWFMNTDSNYCIKHFAWNFIFIWIAFDIYYIPVRILVRVPDFKLLPVSPSASDQVASFLWEASTFLQGIFRIVFILTLVNWPTVQRDWLHKLFLYWKKLRLREVTEDGAVCMQPVSWFYICYPSNHSSSCLLSFHWLFKQSQSQILMVMEPLPLCNSSCRPCWVPQNHENTVIYVIELI